MKAVEAIRSYLKFRKDLEKLFYKTGNSYDDIEPSDKPCFEIPATFWLSSFFNRVKTPYYLGVLVLFYLLWELPRLCLSYLSGLDGILDAGTYAAYSQLNIILVLGDLIVPLSWIFLRRNYKYLVQFTRDLQNKLERGFLMPVEYIKEDDIRDIQAADSRASSRKLKELDEKYTTRFFYGWLSKTLKGQLSVVTDIRYPVFFGLIIAAVSASSSLLFPMFRPFLSNSTLVDQVPASLRNAELAYSTIMVGWSWFTIGVVAWLGLAVWTICLLICGPIVVDFDADAPYTLRKQQYPVVRLALANAFLIAFLTVWSLVLFAGLGLSPTNLTIMMAVMLPVILLLSVWPCYYARTALLRSKDRKEFELELRKNRLDKRGELSSPAYKKTRGQLVGVTKMSVWPLDIKLLVQIVGLLVVPSLVALATILELFQL